MSNHWEFNGQKWIAVQLANFSNVSPPGNEDFRVTNDEDFRVTNDDDSRVINT
ncbi:hypothetical protein UFOVP1361_68 [uncultured Caudovirales phage]|uniref:Uncharacterized protein n=1 Tax=uncultured Caudovirales phage TaxID=2100421 RepID=A0A6J5S1V6_9CAUD|nr:hypothetical protein UFOVP1361_68 [uncultured Caudovirales phage]